MTASDDLEFALSVADEGSRELDALLYCWERGLVFRTYAPGGIDAGGFVRCSVPFVTLDWTAAFDWVPSGWWVLECGQFQHVVDPETRRGAEASFYGATLEDAWWSVKLWRDKRTKQALCPTGPLALVLASYRARKVDGESVR